MPTLAPSRNLLSWVPSSFHSYSPNLSSKAKFHCTWASRCQIVCRRFGSKHRLGSKKGLSKQPAEGLSSDTLTTVASSEQSVPSVYLKVVDQCPVVVPSHVIAVIDQLLYLDSIQN